MASSKQPENIELQLLGDDGSIPASSERVVEIESIKEQPQRQTRLLSWMLSKRVPPILNEEERKLYPEDPKKVFQYLFFWWLIPLYNVGYKRTIEDTDIFKFAEHQKVETHYKVYEKVYNHRLTDWEQKHPGETAGWQLLVKCLIATFPMRWLMAIIYSALWNCSNIAIPMLTKQLILFVEKRIYDRSTPIGAGIGYAFLNGLLTLFSAICFNHTVDLSVKIGIDLKSILIKKSFEKSMKLSAKSRNEFPISKITAMMGNDLSRLEYTLSFFCVAFGMIIGIIASIVLLIYNLGVSSLAGIGLLLVTCSLQGASSKKLFSYRKRLNEFTDTRLGYIRELITTFKTIKFYNWENPFFEKVKVARNQEMNIIMKMKLLRAVIECATDNLPLFSTMISFVILYKVRGYSDVASIFSSLSLFSILSNQVTFLPILFSSSADAISALQRISALLQSEEEIKLLTSNKAMSADSAIEIQDATFEWESFNEIDTTIVEEQKTRQLEEACELQTQNSAASHSMIPLESVMQKNFDGFHNLNVTVKNGEFIIVTGLVGSGKTSFLNAIAGYMKRVSGTLNINGSQLFCGTPWVQNATIRENIVFGSPYDESKYKNVLYACALIDDLKMFEAGDYTEVGERGITLSGGQKARINLARAVYADRDIILLDDVLSAVDAKVGRHIITHCLQGLLKNKTRVLATHQLSLISSSDSVIFLDRDGNVHHGEHELLKKVNSQYARLLSFNSDINTSSEEVKEEDIAFKVEKESDGAIAKGLLMSREEKAVNHLSWEVYKAFLVSGDSKLKFALAGSLLISVLLSTFTEKFTNVWLSFWTEEKFEAMRPSSYMGIYIMFNFLTVIFSFAQMASLSWVINNASKSLVIAAIKRLLHAPVSFMDTTPAGRILNRFTKDTDVLDNEIYLSLLRLVGPLCNIVGSMILTICYLPWVALAIPPLAIVCAFIADYSQSTARETKRIEALRRSHIFNNINEALDGLDTIKLYGAEERFLKINDNNLNRNNESQFVNFSTQRWLTLFLTFPSAFFSFLVALLLASGVFHLSPASTGLLLSSILSFGDLLTTVFRAMLVVENDMNSAERLYQYSKKLEQEAPYKVSAFTPSPGWPVNPSMDFQDVKMSYRPGLPQVLKGVSFKVNPGEKIGICGRTGAGKSSIMTALYRLSELSGGKIVIDGLDISKMGLLDLRSKLSIIPQDTVLFKGTIRFNLDPYGEHSDSTLWEALRKSGLVNDIEKATKFHLELKVDTEGSNFSLGEKQLIALARALARESNILILDEATSSVDYETDSKIQNTIKNEFSNYTILCIAHRLKTILDYDKILVLDAGEVKEFGTPLNLFLKEDGIFQDMCRKSNITRLDFN